jgi:hypothetical protein
VTGTPSRSWFDATVVRAWEHRNPAERVFVLGKLFSFHHGLAYSLFRLDGKPSFEVLMDRARDDSGRVKENAV